MATLYFKNQTGYKARRDASFDEEFHFAAETGMAFEDDEYYFAIPTQNGHQPHFVLKQHTTATSLKDWVEKSFGDGAPQSRPTYVPGTSYKRMARPNAAITPTDRDLWEEKRRGALVALRILIRKLEDLFEVVEPTQANLAVYGHQIREVLLLACMEVESGWTAVLKENSYKSTRGYLTTKDYVRLREPMFLDGYGVSLHSYPHYPNFNPFSTWNAAESTESLLWYSAYNETKHDREENLHYATLEHSVSAVGAAVVMFYAQFGVPRIDFNNPDAAFIRSVFRIDTVNMVQHQPEFYVPKVVIQDEPTGKTANISWEWELLDYPF